MRKVVMALVASLSALLAVPAMAADGTLSAATPNHAWDGSGMNGAQSESRPTPVGLAAARCSPAYSCDNEHLELKDGGTLTVEVKAGAGSNDLDVRLYKSDENGTAPGVQNPNEPGPEPVAQDIRTEKDAKIVVKGLKPGHYVAQVASFDAANGAFTATAVLVPPAPATAPAPAPGPGPGSGAPAPGTTQPAPTTAPAPQQTSPTPAQNKADDTKRKKALAKCNKKAKKIKNAKKRKAAMKKCKKKHAKKR